MDGHEIESYSFGKMVVDGETYTDDLILYPDAIQSRWYRKEGHELSIDDLPEVVKRRPQVLVVGTGSSAQLHIFETTKKKLLEYGIEVVAAPTDRAVNYYNRLKSKKHTIGAFHLTC
ncbi:MAG TPA: hypothetical protein ENN41_06375 [Sediminispirochaeta sp.]|nr:hypothetical protein [Sediminispirochaeta sp.]